MTAALLVHIEDGVATLTFNSPQTRNALGAELREGLAEHVPRLARQANVRALVLQGAGGAFCSGGDLRTMQALADTMDVAGWRARMQELHPWVRALFEMDKPVIAAVDGPAYGAGFSLALAADFILASAQARFCMSFMRVGLIPDCAAAYALPRVVGVQRAKELMLSAREVSAQEALRLGIAMEVLPDADQLAQRAQALARSMAGASAMAVGLVKRTLADAFQQSVGQALQQEAEQQALCFETAEHREAVRRFLTKEKPAFQWPAPQA